MYNIEFYENQSGESELWNFLEKLRNEAELTKIHAYNTNK